MSDENAIDFGPLTELIGVWAGEDGTDIAPDPDGSETNPFFETITYSAVGHVTNAESQTLSAVHYRQRCSENRMASSFTMKPGIGCGIQRPKSSCTLSPFRARYVCWLAENIDVAARLDDEEWQIIQSPFMKDNARTTTEFRHQVTVGNGTFAYVETMIIDIYGKTFEHTDQNKLARQ